MQLRTLNKEKVEKMEAYSILKKLSLKYQRKHINDIIKLLYKIRIQTIINRNTKEIGLDFAVILI